MPIPSKLPIAQPLPGSEGPGYRIKTHLTEHSAILGHVNNPSSLAGKVLSIFSISTPEYVEVDVRLSAKPADSTTEKVWIAVKDIVSNCDGTYSEEALLKDTPEARGAMLGKFISKHLDERVAQEMEGDFEYDPKDHAKGGSGVTSRPRTPEKKEGTESLSADEMLKFIKTLFPAVSSIHDIKDKKSILIHQIKLEISNIERQAKSLESKKEEAVNSAKAAHKKGDLEKARIYAENAVRHLSHKTEALKQVGRLKSLIAYIEKLG